MDGILLLRLKPCIWDINFKICLMSKTIPAAKSQNFVNILGGNKNPHGQDFWNLNLYLKKRLYRYYQNKKST